MIYESMNKRALNVALNALVPDRAELVRKLYELLNTAENVAHGEGYDAGHKSGFNDGWKEGYEAGYENATENIYGAHLVEDMDVASAALDLDPTLMLPAYEGDSGDEVK